MVDINDGKTYCTWQLIWCPNDTYGPCDVVNIAIGEMFYASVRDKDEQWTAQQNLVSLSDESVRCDYEKGLNRKLTDKDREDEFGKPLYNLEE